MPCADRSWQPTFGVTLVLPLMPSVVHAHCDETHSRHAAPGLSSDGVAALHCVPPATKHQGKIPSWKWSPHREYATAAPPLVPFVVHQHNGSSTPASESSV
jgi:hypothetical protein